MRRRPRILFAWELGANYGHATKIAETADAIGPLADIVIAARSLDAIATTAPHLVPVTVQAPYADTPDGRRPVVSYPDALGFCGWNEAETLAGLVRRWRALIAEVEPDMIVSQAAPTALLAARGGRSALAVLGSGYDAPPRAAPMPPFLPGMTQEAAAEAEARTLEIAEAAMARVGGEAPAPFCHLFDVASFALVALPQTDHYGDRAAIEPQHPPYLGQLYSADIGAERDWAGDGRHRILAYLRPGSPGFAAAVQSFAARAGAWDVLLAAPGIGASLRDRLAAAGVRAVDGPLRLDRLMENADLMVSHASNGVVSAAVTAGIPQVLLPTQTEQTMCAHTLARQKLAVGASGRVDAAALTTLLDRALASAQLRASARAAAERVARETPADPAGAAAACLLAAVPRPREI
jgi:UDP:flavonoid glycosyltransferase YjiC (YdhE family)